jgi:hypothetical protein
LVFIALLLSPCTADAQATPTGALLDALSITVQIDSAPPPMSSWWRVVSWSGAGSR